VSVREQGGLWGGRERRGLQVSRKKGKFSHRGWLERGQGSQKEGAGQGVIMVKGSSLRFRHEGDSRGRVSEIKRWDGARSCASCDGW
jgi:hypothetical protein